MRLRINEMILNSGLKKGHIAKRLEINPVTLSKYISGERKISLEMAVELADILDCEVTDLYEKENQNEQGKNI
ncbi:helix-turn-helix transcriptional regulator [Ornithinibacillus sp. JPR2-1]|uniref:helix-turn-helix domain-containing protein n=1 Tax=Ornithinibacillus sp. JPR2-1 TaxID=2094019 RepID=UPI0031DE64B1